jgi:hypothetical protein
MESTPEKLLIVVFRGFTISHGKRIVTPFSREAVSSFPDIGGTQMEPTQ